MNEIRRLNLLRDLGILGSEQEKDFDAIVDLASSICDTPISLISLVDDTRQWFKAKIGIQSDETPRNESFCDHTIRQNDILVVHDARNDERFKNLKMVKGPEAIRFYAGIPIILNGHAIGALCVKDRKPRNLSETQINCLRTLCRQVTILLQLRLQNRELEQAYADARRQETELKHTNDELSKVNEELRSREEDVRTNLEQIHYLQSYLESKEKQYRELIEHANDLIYELDANGQFTFVNDLMESKSGYSKAELYQLRYLDLVMPEDRTRLFDFYRNQMKMREETSYLEFRMQSKMGEPIWIGQNVRMVFEASGWVIKVISVSRDITTLKNTELRLAESERLYRLLSTNSSDIVALLEITPDFRFKFISQSVQQVLGYDPSECIDRDPLFYVFEADAKRVRKSVSKILLHGKPTTIEYRAVKRDGSSIWLESNSTAIFDNSGKVTGLQTSARDITTRKQFEKSLKEAKKKAEAATQAKSQFLSMMSHEIRTPMNAIVGLTNLLLQSSPTTEQQDSLRLLRFSSDNLLTLINDILDFSKIEANKITLESINVDLFNLLDNTIKVLEQRATEKDIRMAFSFPQNVPRNVLGDPVRLSQIFTNLIANAIKFTDRGMVSLNVEYLAEKDNCHRYRFKVEDTGIGIDEDKLRTIFDRFSQAETETTRKYGGTGLGLSITKRLLELMGSSITVASKKGVGSTFEFTLNLPAAKSGSPASITEMPNFKNLDGLTVLLAEDNKVNQIVATAFLKKWGISVTIANNGIEAVRLSENQEFDLILMDLQMPELDGYGACSLIRKLPDKKLSSVPIIALTASASLSMRENVMKAGMSDFISKPFAPDELKSIILRHTSR